MKIKEVIADKLFSDKPLESSEIIQILNLIPDDEVLKPNEVKFNHNLDDLFEACGVENSQFVLGVEKRFQDELLKFVDSDETKASKLVEKIYNQLMFGGLSGQDMVAVAIILLQNAKESIQKQRRKKG